MRVTTTLMNLLSFLRLIIQFAGIKLRVTYAFWRARRKFRRSLVEHGMPEEAAEKIASAYQNPLDGLPSLLRAVRGNSA